MLKVKYPVLMWLLNVFFTMTVSILLFFLWSSISWAANSTLAKSGSGPTDTVKIVKTLTDDDKKEFRTYKEWKHDKIEEARGRMKSQKAKTEAGTTTEARLDTISHKRAERLLKKELSNLDIAYNLTLTDYMVGYLSKLPDRSTAVASIANRLSPEEVAELMNAFSNILTNSHTSSVGTIFSASK